MLGKLGSRSRSTFIRAISTKSGNGKDVEAFKKDDDEKEEHKPETVEKVGSDGLLETVGTSEKGDDKESARSKLNVPLYFTYMADKYPETYKVPTVQKVLSAIEAMQESHGAKANESGSNEALADALYWLFMDNSPDTIKCREMCAYVFRRFQLKFPCDKGINRRLQQPLWMVVGDQWVHAETFHKLMDELAEHNAADQPNGTKPPHLSEHELLSQVLKLHDSVHKLREIPPNKWFHMGIVPDLDKLDVVDSVKAAVFMHGALLELDGECVVLHWEPTTAHGRRFKERVRHILSEAVTSNNKVK